MSQIDFDCAVEACLENKEFMAQYDRLNGTNLSKKLTPIENSIDRATGRREKELRDFISFVDHAIWSPLVERSLKEAR